MVLQKQVSKVKIKVRMAKSPLILLRGMTLYIWEFRYRYFEGDL